MVVFSFSFSNDYLKPFCEIKDLYKCKSYCMNSLYLTSNAIETLTFPKWKMCLIF